MRTAYRILFFIAFIAASPFYALRMFRRGGWSENFSQRFGNYSPRIRQELTNRHILWLHAVSVGEVGLLHQLVARIEHRLPGMKLVATTTTSTGMAELRRLLPSSVTKLYFPFDFQGSVTRASRILNPQAAVLVEAEIWPNFLWRLEERGVPVFLVNARISARSHRRYRLFRPLFAPLFRSFAAVGAQSEEDAKRLAEIGCRPERVHVFGNMKFDAPPPAPQRTPLNIPAIFAKLGVDRDAPVLVAGSTHAGEEEILLRVAERLRGEFPGLFLVLVPRHHERAGEVRRLLEQRRVKHALRSNVLGLGDAEAKGATCLLVDTTGELRFFYGHATAAFIGKSLTAHGGQNPIEPASLGKPVVFGPNMENFTAIADDLVQGGGALRVADEAGLESALRRLLAGGAFLERTGESALAVVRRRQGALDGTVEMLLRALKAQGEHVVGMD